MIFLLTHERELLKETNTGQLAQRLLPNYVERILWSRVEPDESLLALLALGRTALVYPSEDAVSLSESVDAFDHFVLLDATWQQAQKMYNRSAYLKSVAKIYIDTDIPSKYQLRRNQRPGGLCTAECVGEILKSRAMLKEYKELQESFRSFNRKNKSNSIV